MVGNTSALSSRVRQLLGSRNELESTKTLLNNLLSSDLLTTASDCTDPLKEQPQIDENKSIINMEVVENASLANLRKNLRHTLEEKQLQLAESALEGLDKTLTKIQHMKKNVDNLDAQCSEIQGYLEKTKKETQAVQAEAQELVKRKEILHGDLEKIKVFLHQYQLSDEEIEILYDTSIQDQDIHRFFDVMERLQTIKTDCKALVTNGELNCGLELLDTVGKYQEVGFERLYQWTTKKCSEVGGEPSNQLHRAIAILRDREEFYNYCKECITVSRRALLVRRFIIALTRGGPNGIPRPIEIHAHDPVRYCGDMLAWIHQAVATEKEFFKVLFDGDLDFSPSTSMSSSLPATSIDDFTIPGIDDTDPTLMGTATSNITEEKATPKCVSMVGIAFEGVARPLKVRIEQTLTSQHGIVIAYRLVHLLAFYHHKLNYLVKESSISHVLQSCREAANRAFHHQFQAMVDYMTSFSQDYSGDLSVTHATMEIAHRLVSLLEVFQTSLLPEEEQEADLSPLFNGILPAIMQMCEKSIVGFDPIEAWIFKVNNFGSIQISLKRFPEARKWYTNIENDVSSWLDIIASLQVKQITHKCMASSLQQKIAALKEEEIAAQTAGLEAERIGTVMEGFCTLLMSLSFPQFDRIVQPDVREKARLLTATKLADTYKFIYDFVKDPKNGYDTSITGIVPHTPHEVRTVLEID